jgi:raffinose/stachyose/melibiose transport system permease protein
MGTATLEAPAVGTPVVRRRRKKYGGLNAWLFALPALAVYVIFLVYPAFTSLWFSFTDWDGLSPTYNVVGLENYLAIRRTRWLSRR